MNSSSRAHRILAIRLACIPLVAATFGGMAAAQGTDVTAPGDPIVGVAATPGSNTSTLATVGTVQGLNQYPAIESPPNAIDDVVATKYLNFGEINVGLIVTPSAPSVLGGLRFTTANDSPERDPLTVALEGTNDPNATTTLNSTWTTIYNGDSGLTTDPGRNMPGATVGFAAGSFTSYRLLVLSVRTGATANSMQFAEIELLIGAAGTAYCAGDGSGTACPCGNSSAPGAMSGCLSSLGTGGKLAASGSASLSGDTVLLSGTQMANSSALYFQGTTQAVGGLGIVFGDGLRCVTGSIVRLGIETNVAGASSYPGGTDLPVSVRGNVLAPGTRTYQVWYRNAAAFCSPSTFNLTNGWTVTWSA